MRPFQKDRRVILEPKKIEQDKITFLRKDQTSQDNIECNGEKSCFELSLLKPSGHRH